MLFLKYFIIVTIVPFILDMLRYKNEPKNYTKSLNKFTIRTGKTMILLGAIAFVFTTAVLMLMVYNKEEISTVIIGMAVFCYSLAFFSFLYPAPRFWDIVVDGDSIKVIKFFIFTKKTAFSEIEKVEIANNNYLKIYKDGRKYTGIFKNNQRHGKGVLIRPDGTKFIGFPTPKGAII